MAPPVILSRDPGPIRKNWDWEKYPCPPAWLTPIPLPLKSSVAPDINIPPMKRSVSLKYNDVKVKWGIKIDPEKMVNQPDTYWIAQERKWYTLVMVDLDAPSREEPEFRQELLWLVVNIKEEFTTRGTVLAEYLPPHPEENTGEHRIVAYVFKQMAKIKFVEDILTVNDLEQRKKFAVKKFARKYLLGIPLYGTFFFTEYVPPPPPPPPPKKGEEE